MVMEVEFHVTCRESARNQILGGQMGKKSLICPEKIFNGPLLWKLEIQSTSVAPSNSVNWVSDKKKVGPEPQCPHSLGTVKPPLILTASIFMHAREKDNHLFWLGPLILDHILTKKPYHPSLDSFVNCILPWIMLAWHPLAMTI